MLTFASMRHNIRLCCALLIFVAAPFQAAAAGVEEVSSYLKRAEDTLTLVDGSIGHMTSPPKGSAGKLSRMRVDQASADLASAKSALDGLGAGAGVDEVKTRYATAIALRDRLNGILDGPAASPPAPTPATPTTPSAPKAATPKPASTTTRPAPAPAVDPKPADSAAPTTVKLGYPHADAFKGALFNLRRVEGDAVALRSLREQLEPVADQMSIHHGKVSGAMGTIAETRRQAGFVRDALAKIPSNGEGVAEAAARLADVESSLAESERYFKPLNDQLASLIDPNNYPEFQNDLRRLQELAVMYNNPEVMFVEQRERAAEALAQGDAAQAECARIARVYAPLMVQETEQGKRIEGAGNGFLSRRADFLAVAEQQKSQLPASIRADLAEANQYADEAVQNKKPLWFTGGVPQRMGWADEKLALYAVLDPAGAATLEREVAAMKASIRSRADSLRDLIIQENTLPEDRFAGADRNAAIAVAKDGWKHQEPGMEVLAVRIPAEAWARETKWTYSNGTWYFVDRSSLQVRLIVADKENATLAIDRPVTVWKDHQKGDSMIGVPFRSFDEELTPGEYLLRSKVR